ncbi:hypothetical protein LguiB_027411 [Lonicera macranthoides]
MPSFNSLHTLIILTISCIQTIPSSSLQLYFNFPDFGPNIHGLNYFGHAYPSDGVIQLTINQKDKNMISSSGRVTYFETMQLWDKSSKAQADFSTHFSFAIIADPNNTYNGDGIAFFLAPLNFPLLPDQCRSDGGGLGLVCGEQIRNSTMNPFVAVEFDTFANPWDPNTYVAGYSHVGINVNSMISVKNVTWWDQINNSSQIYEAWVTYNSTTKNLSVVFTSYFTENVSHESLYEIIDLSKYLPERVSFGFSAATGMHFEIHNLCSWEFNSTINIVDNVISPISSISPSQVETAVNNITVVEKGNNRKVVVGFAVGGSTFGLILISLLGFILFRYRRKEMKSVEKKEEAAFFEFSSEFENETGPKKFSYKELAVATNDFVEEGKVGEGGFGGVYKGFLRELNSYVAVKRVSRGSKQGIKEYASEVRTISRLRHRNLVQLIGWCHEERELLLVYEYMPNGSLDYHLFKESGFLTWAMRYSIAKGLASALLYLHEEWEQCVLHRDIKSSNIMLDLSFNAKLGDFGLARLVDHSKGAQTTLLAGTMGYMAPECVITGQASKGSDVYSFGIVALEIASGLKPMDQKGVEGQVRLVDRIWDLYGLGKLLEGADPKLCGDFDDTQMECLMIVGLWCAHPDHSLRPSIRQAIQVLSLEAPLPNLPSAMPVPFYIDKPMDMNSFSLSSSYKYTEKGQTVLSSSSSYSSKVITTSSAGNSSKVTTTSSAGSSSALL